MRNMIAPIAILICAAAVSMLAAEGAVRYLRLAPPAIELSHSGKESAYQPSRNPILGYELKPSFRSAKPDCHHTFPYTNAHGFRDRERTIEKPPGTRRIILLGDSVVAGHGVCDLKDTISQKLESKLQNIEVFNVAAGGYCTRAEVELLKEKALQFSPDEVILLFVGNDFVNENTRIALPFDRPKILESIFQTSSLFRATVWSTDLFSFRSQLDPTYALKAEAQLSGKNNVEEGFELLSALSKAHNFKVKILTWPYFTDRAIEPSEKLLVNPQNYKLPDLEALSSQFNFVLLRLEPSFQKDFEKRSKNYQGNFAAPSPRWFYTTGDGTHPSKLGAEVAARAISKVFRPN